MEINEITQKVKQFLINEFEIEEDKIYPEANLKSDMGIDSLDFVDIVIIVEDIFGFRLNTEDLKQISTFQEFCEFIQSKTKK